MQQRNSGSGGYVVPVASSNPFTSAQLATMAPALAHQPIRQQRNSNSTNSNIPAAAYVNPPTPPRSSYSIEPGGTTPGSAFGATTPHEHAYNGSSGPGLDPSPRQAIWRQAVQYMEMARAKVHQLRANSNADVDGSGSSYADVTRKGVPLSQMQMNASAMMIRQASALRSATSGGSTQAGQSGRAQGGRGLAQRPSMNRRSGESAGGAGGNLAQAAGSAGSFISGQTRAPSANFLTAVGSRGSGAGAGPTKTEQPDTFIASQEYLGNWPGFEFVKFGDRGTGYYRIPEARAAAAAIAALHPPLAPSLPVTAAAAAAAATAALPMRPSPFATSVGGSDGGSSAATAPRRGGIFPFDDQPLPSTSRPSSLGAANSQGGPASAAAPTGGQPQMRLESVAGALAHLMFAPSTSVSVSPGPAVLQASRYSSPSHDAPAAGTTSSSAVPGTWLPFDDDVPTSPPAASVSTPVPSVASQKPSPAVSRPSAPSSLQPSPSLAQHPLQQQVQQQEQQLASLAGELAAARSHVASLQVQLASVQVNETALTQRLVAKEVQGSELHKDQQHLSKELETAQAIHDSTAQQANVLFVQNAALKAEIAQLRAESDGKDGVIELLLAQLSAATEFLADAEGREGGEGGGYGGHAGDGGYGYGAEDEFVYVDEGTDGVYEYADAPAGTADTSTEDVEPGTGGDAQEQAVSGAQGAAGGEGTGDGGVVGRVLSFEGAGVNK